MKYITNRRINVRTVRNIKNNEGLTLRNGKIVEYRTGWQVGITGIEAKTAEEVSRILHSEMGRKGNLGIWFSEGIFAIGVKFIMLLLGALGVANMWEAVFADVGVTVLAIANAMRAMQVKVK